MHPADPTVPSSPRRPFAALAVAAALVLPAVAACGASSAPDGTKNAPASVEDTQAPAGSGAGAGGSVPTVKNATDLSSKPVPAAGQGNPPTSLVSKDLVVGQGAQASASSTVTVHYVGALWSNGKQFDASWDTGQPAQFSLDQVIPGFKNGIAGMKVGGRRELVIPPDQGYGAQATGPIPANSTLIFVVDLKAVG